MGKRIRLKKTGSPVVTQQSSGAKPPDALAKLFANPPLIGNERSEDYQALFEGIADAIKPADTMIWLWIYEVVDRSWEIARLMRLKVRAIELAKEDAVAEFLRPKGMDVAGLGYATARAKARLWASDTDHRRQINQTLANMGFNEDDILAKAYMLGSSVINAFDAGIESCENRRSKAWILIKQYSGELANQLQRASAKIIDGEFTEAAAA